MKATVTMNLVIRAEVTDEVDLPKGSAEITILNVANDEDTIQVFDALVTAFEQRRQELN